MGNHNEAVSSSRRNFLKGGITGLAGATLLPSVLRGDEQKKPGTGKRKLIYRTLGKTGIRLPVISMGAGADDPNVYKAALDAGILHLDTAFVYGRGSHETKVGKVIKGRPRDSFVIGTKVLPPQDRRTGLPTKGAGGDQLLKDFEVSLKRLGLEYVEILYLHSISKKEAVLYKPFMEAIQKIKKSGRAKYIGVSTHTNEPEVIHAMVDAGIYDVVLTSYNFRQPHLKEMEAAIERAGKAGMGIVAMKTQAGAFWDQEKKKPINMKAAMKWVLQNKYIHTTIPAFKNFDQMEEYFEVMANPVLSPQEKADLKLGEKTAMAGLYCGQCSKCIAQCPKNLQIPTMMRSYMYAYGYGKPAQAKETLAHLELKGTECSDCSSCRVTCTQGFNIKDRVTDIARIARVPDEFLV